VPDRRNAETETALIERAQNGDRDAYEELVRRYYTSVVNIVHRMCGDTSLAEDAAQEAFLSNIWTLTYREMKALESSLPVEIPAPVE
jgi:DNA-directed RNA polymerase specialized sigma24 family protein